MKSQRMWKNVTGIKEEIMKKMNNILNIILVIMLVIIIINPIIGGIIFSANDRRPQMVQENTKEENIRFCNLTSIKLFDGRLYCLNDSQRMIAVLSKNGKFEKNILLPGKNDAGANDIYIFKNDLCIITTNNELYQYTSADDYKRIVYNKKQMEIYDQNNKLINKMPAYDDQILYCNENAKYAVTYDFTHNLLKEYENGVKKEEKKIDYDTITKKNHTVSQGNVVYRIGKLRNSILKEEGDTKTVLYRASCLDTLLYSDVIANASIVIFVLCTILKYFRKR